jgi:oligopeptidase B
VLYVEPAKWVARLRATDPAGEGRPDILLKTEMSAGHGGVSGRYRVWRDRAFTQAWMLDRMGLADVVPVTPPEEAPPASTEEP